MTLPQEIIRSKRDGGVLPAHAIAEFIGGLASGAITDAQVAAFAMAVFLKGMAREETVALTLAMRDSGAVLGWPETDRPVVDKHSTGGVGDNVSLMLGPIAAACGLSVPMISGRGLGHSGGTLDKLDSIPGYVSQPDNALFRKVVGEVGCAIIGQTEDLAPADRRLYSIRDVTATVESIPLITASILSKKLAAGLQGLVMDVKTGGGAFMAREADAVSLAESLVEVALGAGLPTVALITDMDQPLASAAGNAVEIANAIEFLTGSRRDPRLEEVTLRLAGEMLAAGGLEQTAESGVARALASLEDGRAAERFARMVAALGGPTDLLERPEAHLPGARIVREITSVEAGYVSHLATREIGLAVVTLGGGRRRAEDAIDPSVGFSRIAPVGTQVGRGDRLAIVHAASGEAAAIAERAFRDAITIAGTAPAPRAPVLRRVG